MCKKRDYRELKNKTYICYKLVFKLKEKIKNKVGL